MILCNYDKVVFLIQIKIITYLFNFFINNYDINNYDFDIILIIYI